MKVLITGGAGFIGSNLVDRLVKDNDVYVVDNLSTGNINNIKYLIDSQNIHFINLDITDSKITSFIKENNFDVIYNFACPASPKYYLKHPIETWSASVIGVKNLLDGIKGTSTRMFHSSTSEIYGDALQIPQSENYWGNVNSIGVRACYDEGKRAAEALIYDYIRIYDVDVRVARIFNTYGPKMLENDGRIISNFINQALLNKDITIYGSGMQTRSFCYIDDTLDFIVKLTNKNDKINKPVNVGNPVEITVLDVAKFILKNINTDSKIVYLEAMSDDPKRRKPDISRAKSILGWTPTVSFEEGVSKTIEYFKGKM